MRDCQGEFDYKNDPHEHEFTRRYRYCKDITLECESIPENNTTFSKITERLPRANDYVIAQTFYYYTISGNV